MLSAILPLLLAAATPAPEHVVAHCSSEGHAFDLVSSSDGTYVRNTAAEDSAPLALATGGEGVLPAASGSTVCDNALAVPLRGGLVLIGLRWEKTGGTAASDGGSIYDPATHRIVEWFRGADHAAAVERVERGGYLVTLAPEPAGAPPPAVHGLRIEGHAVQSIDVGATEPRVHVRFVAGQLEARVDTTLTWERAAAELRTVFGNEDVFAEFFGHDPILGRFEHLHYVRAQLDDGRICIAPSAAAMGQPYGWHCAGDDVRAPGVFARCKADHREFEIDWDPRTGTSIRRSAGPPEPLPLRFLGTARPAPVEAGRLASVCDHTLAAALPDGTVLITALHAGAADGGRVLSAIVYAPGIHRILAQAEQLGVEPVVKEVASNTVRLVLVPPESGIGVGTEGLLLADQAVRSVDIRGVRIARRLRYVSGRVENRDDVDATLEENIALKPLFKKPGEFSTFIGYDALSGRAMNTSYLAVTLPGPIFCVAPNTAAALVDGDYWRCTTKEPAK